MLSPGSWWVNKKTGQRMVVPKVRLGGARTRISKRKSVQHVSGYTPDRIGCYVEGYSLYPVYLTTEEVHAAWKRYRPTPDRTFIPSWLQNSYEKDEFQVKLEGLLPEDWFGRSWDWKFWSQLTADREIWVGIQGIRSGWFCFCGLDPTDQKSVEPYSYWPYVRMTTFWAPASKVVGKMTPKFHRPRPDAWDLIMSDEDLV